MGFKGVVITLILILMFGIALFGYYGTDIDRVATHWNSKGDVDGYMSKLWGFFMLPIITLLLFLVFLFIPKLDPLKNIHKFKKQYDGLVLFLVAFLFYVYILMVLYNLDYELNMTNFLIPAIAILFYYLGTILGSLEQSWFIGIRTPWTLSSEEVWKKTHELGGKLFRVFGFLVLLGFFFEESLAWYILTLVLILVVGLFVYSYFVYKEVELTKGSK